MKTNVPIETTDEERSILASIVDGRENKRLISRNEIVGLCEGMIEGMIDYHNAVQERFGAPDDELRQPTPEHPNLTRYAAEIEAGLVARGHKGKPSERGYLRGWTMEPFKR